MNKGLILLIALWALIAFANARPLMFFADQTDAPLGLANSWTGIVYAWTTSQKGQFSHRIRIFGGTNINQTLTGAWLQYLNGTVIEQLAFSKTSDRYFLGDVHVNSTVWTAFLQEEVYATVASTSNSKGSITGFFRCRPNQGVAILDAAQVVAGSSSSAEGLGWAEIAVSAIDSLPQDILAQDVQIAATSLFNGRVMHNATGATAITFNGPANSTNVAGALATAALYSQFNDGKFTGVAVTSDFYSIASGNTYFEVTATSGDIRGQIFPLLTPTRRQIPYSVNTVNGVTGVPAAGFGTLRYANQVGTERNANSFISLTSTANPTNFTYLGLFYMNSATNKRNFDLVRALTVELNAKIAGTGTWLFEFFDSTTGEFLPAGTLSSASNWTPAFIDNWTFSTSEFANNRQQLIMRISVNSDVQSTLYLDLFGVRSWTPSSFTNQALKDTVKFLDSLPAVFANGTTVNQ